MKTSTKVILGILVLALAGGGAYYEYRVRRQGEVIVQTSQVARSSLSSIVTASGEIKPRTYTNLAANAQGRVTALMVAEGDHVRKGQVVAQIEKVQAEADVDAQRATVASAQSDAASAEVGLKVADDTIAVQTATVERTKKQLDIARINFQRTADLLEAGVIARQEYDRSKSDYEQQQVGLTEAQLRLRQAETQRAQTAASIASSQRRVTQAQAQLSRVADILEKHDVIAPHDGVVTNLPVRVGETVVPGVQNSAASAVMTIADMSLITAEVKVDETDIVNLKLGQTATILIDAVGTVPFTGRVIEIGNTAILRSTGAVASNSATTSSEAKDFKVVIALDSPPAGIRPGLSCTAKITTATHNDVIAIPIQALTVRQKGDLDDAAKDDKQKEAEKKADSSKPIDLVAQKAAREEVIGVFVISNGIAEFRPVQTSISGATDIEITSGLKQGEQIIIGGYQIIRTLKPGAKVTIDNQNGVDLETKA
ncbi:MAG: efflux RND transporter periplasmic adaptor subunit [Acidobacteriota bacterium]